MLACATVLLQVASQLTKLSRVACLNQMRRKALFITRRIRYTDGGDADVYGFDMRYRCLRRFRYRGWHVFGRRLRCRLLLPCRLQNRLRLRVRIFRYRRTLLSFLRFLTSNSTTKKIRINIAMSNTIHHHQKPDCSSSTAIDSVTVTVS